MSKRSDRIVEKVTMMFHVSPHSEDFAPLGEFLDMVTGRVEHMGVKMTDPAARQAWCEIVEWGIDALNHNTYMPCGYCNREFIPIPDQAFLDLWLTDSNEVWRCPECGGRPARAVQVREEDDVEE